MLASNRKMNIIVKPNFLLQKTVTSRLQPRFIASAEIRLDDDKQKPLTLNKVIKTRSRPKQKQNVFSQFLNYARTGRLILLSPVIIVF